MTTTYDAPEVTTDATLIVLSAEDCARIRAVLPHASTDRMEPALQVIHLFTAPDGTIYAEATDRYSLARAELDACTDAQVDIALDARQVAKFLRGSSAKRSDVQVTVTPGMMANTHTVTLRAADGTGAMPTSEPQDAFPRLERIIERAISLDDSPAGVILGMRPEHVGKFDPKHTGTRDVRIRPVGRNEHHNVPVFYVVDVAGADWLTALFVPCRWNAN